MHFDEKIQLIIVGESCVGKTSILYKYTQGIFTNQHLSTIGLEFFTKDVTIDDKVIRVKIWDTAGQEQYKSLTKNFFRNSDGVIIVYDATQKATFDQVKEWVRSIEDYTSTEKKVQKILVANKIDLKEKIEVTTEEGQKLSENFEIPFFEVSAKENIGISECMERIIRDVVKNVSEEDKGVNLSQPKDVEKEKKNCNC